MTFKHLLFLFFSIVCIAKAEAQKKFACTMYWFNQLQIADFEKDIKKFDEALVNIDLNDNLAPPKMAAIAEMENHFGRKMLGFSIFRLAIQNGYTYTIEPSLAKDSVLWKRFKSELYIFENFRMARFDTLSSQMLQKLASEATKNKNKSEVLAHLLTFIEKRGFPTYKSVFTEGMNNLYTVCRSLISLKAYSETLEPIIKLQTLQGNFDNMVYADISDRHRLYFSSDKKQNFGTITQNGALSKLSEISNIDVRRAEVGLMPLKYAALLNNTLVPENYVYADLKNAICP